MAPHQKPILAVASVPAVSATTGLGIAGGAGVSGVDDNGAEGQIRIITGAGFSASGSVSLKFPMTPQALFFEPEEAFGPITQATVGNVVTVSWSAAKFVPNLKPVFIKYMWASFR